MQQNPLGNPDDAPGQMTISGESAFSYSSSNIAIAAALITLGFPYQEKNSAIVRVTGDGIPDPHGNTIWYFAERSTLNPELTTAMVLSRWNDREWCHGPGTDTQLAGMRCFHHNLQLLLKRVKEGRRLERVEHGKRVLLISNDADLRTQSIFAARMGL